MGESVAEATLTKWLKDVGDTVALDDPIVEIATDKVDTDVTSEVEGVILEKRFKENEVVEIGQVLVVIQTDQDQEEEKSVSPQENVVNTETILEEKNSEKVASELEEEIKTVETTILSPIENSNRFYSPLVKNIAKKEGISQSELDQIPGTGKEQRLTKRDLLNYLKKRTAPVSSESPIEPLQISPPAATAKKEFEIVKPIISGGDQILEMTRMEKLIATNMKNSLETSAHVQSFIEVDVTRLWDWRDKVKEAFSKRENEKLTFTPLFMTAIIKALRDYPALNSSMEGDKIHIKKDINLGMATALPDGNLIVPVIKNADHLKKQIRKDLLVAKKAK